MTLNTLKMIVEYNGKEYEISHIPKSLGSLIEEVHKQILQTKEYC